MRAAAVVLVACGGHPAAAPDACHRTTLYLNHSGGTYDHGPHDDAVANTSTVVDAPHTLPAWPRPATEWSQTAACIRTGLAPFAIDITEQDPSPAPHVEIVFTTAYWAQPAATAVLVPASCFAGHQLEFVFSDALPPTPTPPCHEALIGFAEMTALLSPVDDCHDLLNRAMDCSPTRAFVDQTATCVDDTGQPAACRCGGTTENTYRALVAAHPAC